MSKVSRWLAPLAAAAIIAPTAPATAGTGYAGYSLTVPDQVVIASSGCTSMPYSIGMSPIQMGDREEGSPVEIRIAGVTYSSPSGWGEIGTTPTGATTGTVQVCDAVPGNFQAETDYTAYDSQGNILGAYIIWADVTFVAPTTTKATAASTQKKKCKRVRRHHHWVRVCHR